MQLKSKRRIDTVLACLIMHILIIAAMATGHGRQPMKADDVAHMSAEDIFSFRQQYGNRLRQLLQAGAESACSALHHHLLRLIALWVCRAQGRCLMGTSHKVTQEGLPKPRPALPGTKQLHACLLLSCVWAVCEHGKARPLQHTCPHAQWLSPVMLFCAAATAPSLIGADL